MNNQSLNGCSVAIIHSKLSRFLAPCMDAKDIFTGNRRAHDDSSGHDVL